MKRRGRILAGPSRPTQVRLLVTIVSLAGTIRCSSHSTNLDHRAAGEPELDGAVAADTEVPSDAGDDCGGGSFGEASDGDRTLTTGMATVELLLSGDNEILELDTTLVVPRTPTGPGTLFVWPGLQPVPMDVERYPEIGNGVVQTVLTWGPTCAPEAPADPYGGWWISGEYVNTDTSDEALLGCHGGPGISVEEDDVLRIVLRKSDTIWSESIANATSGAVANYGVNLGDQPQKRALFAVERPGPYSSGVLLDAVFTKIRVTFANPEPAACQPTVHGIRDTFTRPRASKDGRTCCIDRLTLQSSPSDPR